MYNKIILAGGNGYLGQVLAAYYRNVASEVIILARRFEAEKNNIKTVVWDGLHDGEWSGALEGAELLINLCGKNVNCRYNQKNREEIIHSRVLTTRLLGNVIRKLVKPPKLWINITSATIYRHAEDHAQDEYGGEIGYGFSIDVCRQWEAAFFESDLPETRKVALRLGIVLGRQGAVFPRLLNLVKVGLGGRQGNGQQYISWIHEQDVVKCTEWLLQHEEISGVVNGTAPNPVKNFELMDLIRKAYGVPLGLPSPSWLLEAGAIIIGTETELILKSRWVVPKRLLDAGYTFAFSHASHAVNDILSIRV